MNPYLATFELGGGRRLAALLETPPIDSLNTTALAELAEWLVNSPVDFALRVEHRTGIPSRCTVWLNAAAEDQQKLCEAVESLSMLAAPAFVACKSAESYDALTMDFPPYHLALEPLALRWRGYPIAAEASAVPLLLRVLGQAFATHRRAIVQVAFQRVAHDDKEVRRAVRKHLVSTEHEALPASVRETQTLLLNRVLEPGWLWSAVLVAQDASAVGAYSQLAKQSQVAQQSAGQSIAHELQHDDRQDELLTGFHPAVFRDEVRHPADLASERLSKTDVRQLLLELLQQPDLQHQLPRGTAPVFVSYSARDYASAADLRDHLERVGLPCWMAPRDIPPGMDYPEAIIQALDQCRALVLVHSQISNASPHVMREVERTLHRRKPIFPVVVDSSRPSGAMEYLLSTCQRIDATGANRAAALEQLTRRLASLNS